jgi:flagellar protein FliL
MAKSDAKESKDKDAAPAADKAGAAPAADKSAGADKGGGLKAWLPAIVAVVLAPAASFAVAQFILLPKIQKQIALAAPPAAAHGDPNGGGGEEPAATEGESGGGEQAGGHGGKEGPAAPGNYEFSNVVVNLSGTMGTRYLKTSFIVTPIDKKGNLKAVFEEQKARLTDITLNVLSSLTLSDLEEPGAKNVLREKLVATYNQALGKRMVDQVYFSDFVVQ